MGPVVTSFKEDKQSGSRLLSLPGELRLKIYETVLGSHKIHCLSMREHFGYFVCANPETCDCHSETFNENKTPWALLWEDVTLPPGVGRPSLQLLRTCRQIYTEAAHVPYTGNDFTVHSVRSLFHLTQDMPSYRVKQIKNLSLVFNFGSLSVIPGTFQRTWVRTKDMPTTDTVWNQAWKLLPVQFLGVNSLYVWLEAISIENLFHDDSIPWVKPFLNARSLPLKKCRVRFTQSNGEPRPRADELEALEKRIESMLLTPAEA